MRRRSGPPNESPIHCSCGNTRRFLAGSDPGTGSSFYWCQDCGRGIGGPGAYIDKRLGLQVEDGRTVTSWVTFSVATDFVNLSLSVRTVD